MPIAKTLLFTRRQRSEFGKLFREARVASGLTQLDVARKAFDYNRSHCKVSRVERSVMPNVDAYAIERIANALGIPRIALEAIDPKFSGRAAIAKVANAQGFWTHAVAAA